MKDNLTIAQWAKVMGYKKLDDEWYQDEVGNRIPKSVLCNYQSNTKVVRNEQTIFMLEQYMDGVLNKAQQEKLFDMTDCILIAFIDNWDAMNED